MYDEKDRYHIGRGRPLTLRLTAADVKYIYHMYEQDRPMDDIVKFFGLSRLSIQRIIDKNKWSAKQKKLWEADKLPDLEKRPRHFRPNKPQEPVKKPETKVIVMQKKVSKTGFRRPEYVPPPAPLSDFIEHDELDKAIATIKKAEDLRNMQTQLPEAPPELKSPADIFPDSLFPRRKEEEINMRILRQKMDNVFAALELLVDELQGFKKALIKLR